MRYLIALIFLLFYIDLIAQPKTANGEILLLAEDMPRFPGCEDMEGTAAEKETCSQEKLLAFIYKNITYPDTAAAQGIEGTVVVRFVVNNEGWIVQDTILKDIGGGCGAETIRAVKLMNEMPERWTPGKNENKPMNVYFTLPVKFRLEDPDYNPDFVIIEGDSIWVNVEEPADFTGGAAAFNTFMEKHLKYPFAGNIDCQIGTIEIKALIRSDGTAKVMEITDYSSLGFDFWYEAIAFVNQSNGKWTPARFQGRAVNSTTDIKLIFKPQYECEKEIGNFSKATEFLQEGIELFETDSLDQSIEKFSAAVDLFPENAEFLALRGQAYIEANRLEDACLDLKKVRALLQVDWYDQFLPFICK